MSCGTVSSLQDTYSLFSGYAFKVRKYDAYFNPFPPIVCPYGIV